MKLNGFQLKIIAVVLMVLDHIHQFIPGTPLIFTQLGRLVAPIFLFIAVEGYHYTRSREKYIARLMGFGVVMFMGSRLLVFLLPSNQSIPNNIFFSIGLSLSFIYLTETLRRKENLKRDIPLILLTLFAISFAEGSFLVLWIAVIFYQYRGHKKQLAVNFVMISLLLGFVMTDFRLIPKVWIYENFQWMMLFSTPLILLYNGERGIGMKYFFYVFYPMHIWIIYSISVVYY